MSYVTYLRLPRVQTTHVTKFTQSTVITRISIGIPGPSPIHRGPTPPADATMLWVDTNL